MSASKEHMQQNDPLKDSAKPELKTIKETHKDLYMSSRDLHFSRNDTLKSKLISSNASDTFELSNELSKEELHDLLAKVVRLEQGTVVKTELGYIFSINTGNSEQQYQPASNVAIAHGLHNYLEKNVCGNGMHLADLLKTACIPIKSTKSTFSKNTQSKP